MTSIDTLFEHIEDLTRINVDNILQDMIAYGNSLNATEEQ